ncbi:helix-turn-helix domain-containing protein [Kribbella sp. NPDC056861]|uniref:TetR/AcrR family transcriptional regulator n=1 Tax=Kribbella sp. NPDC056861 TaxID=3154857 RepID=UPI003422AC84
MATAPLRKDAERNRERLIQAAQQVFAERGLDVALEAVAKQAGVSIGTLYNRFPTRADLVRATFADRVETVGVLAEHALGLDDPWDGFVYFVQQVSQLQAADRGYNELAGRGGAPTTEQPTEDQLRGYDLMSQIVERARDGGRLRPDFTLEDMAFITWSVTRTIEATAATSPTVWQRHLALILDGLQTPAAHPLPEPPLTRDQLAGIYRNC